MSSLSPKQVPRTGAVWLPVMAALVMAGATGWLFRGFWTPKVFLAGHDTFSHDYLMWDWGWRSTLEHLRMPLWNPYLFGGWPFVASFAFCPFYPPAWLSVPFPTSLAMTTQYALHLWLGALGFLAFTRAMRIHPAAALAAALWYLAAGHVTSLANPGHLAKVQAIAWLPWAMAATVRLVATARIRWAVALGFCWALQLLASHAQIFYATAGLSGLYLVGSALGHRPPDEATARWNGKRKAIVVALGILAGIVAAGVSAVQMAPAWEMARQSNRGGGLARKTALHGAMPPADLVEAALPSYLGDSTGRLVYDLGNGARVALGYTGRWNANAKGQGAERVVSDYLGIWSVALALAGLVLSRRRARWFFGGMAILTCLVVVGDATPVFGMAYRFVPGFAFFRSPGTLFVVAHFSVFTLAALGAEAILERLDRSAQTGNGGKHAAAALAIVGIATGAVAWVWGNSLSRGVMSELTPAATRLTREQIGQLALSRALGHVGLWLVVGGAFATAMVFLRTTGQQRKWQRWGWVLAGLGVVCAGTLDGLTHVRHFLPRDATERIEGYLHGHFVENAILEKSGNAPLPTVIEAGRELNCRPMMRGVRSIHGYHPVVLGAYEKLIAASGGFLSKTVSRLFSQNFRVVPSETATPEGWRSEPLPDGRMLQIRIAPIPTAWVPRNVEPLGTNWETLSAKEWKAKLGRIAASIPELAIADGEYEWSSDNHAAPNRAGSTGHPAVELYLTSPGHLFLVRKNGSAGKGDASIPCVVSIPAAPGWKARFLPRTAIKTPATGNWLEGWPKRANGFFLLAPLSPDSKTVTELVYRPASATIGRLVTLLTLALLLAGALWTHIRARRA